MKAILAIIISSLLVSCANFPQQDTRTEKQKKADLIGRMLTEIGEFPNEISSLETNERIFTRPKSNELLGYWKMIETPLSNANEYDPWPQAPIQLFAFFDDGSFYSMQASEHLNVTNEKFIETIEAVRQDSQPFIQAQNYRYNGYQMLITNPAVKDYREIWDVSIFTSSNHELGDFIKSGDIVMALSKNKDNIAQYYRVMRKIQ